MRLKMTQQHDDLRRIAGSMSDHERSLIQRAAILLSQRAHELARRDTTDENTTARLGTIASNSAIQALLFQPRETTFTLGGGI